MELISRLDENGYTLIPTPESAETPQDSFFHSISKFTGTPSDKLKARFLKSDLCTAIRDFCAEHKCSLLFHTNDEKQFYSQINCEVYGEEQLYSSPLLHLLFDQETFLFFPLVHISELGEDYLGCNYALSQAISIYLAKSMYSKICFC